MKAKGFQDYRMTYFTPLPGEELPAGRPRRSSPLHDKLKAQGCVHTETFGWERPKWFSLDGREEDYSYKRSNVFDVVRDECIAVRERVGILDLTGFAKYDVTGVDAESYLNRICANRMPENPGGIALAHVLSEGGRIAAEMTITRLANNRFYVLSAAGAEMRDLDHLAQGRTADERVDIVNVTDDRGVLVLAGPRSRELLAQITEEKLDNVSFRWLSGKEIRVAGLPARALRVNYVGELGWELHPAMEHTEAIYDALWQAGEELGIANFGLYAVNSLRIEKAYRGWGAELTNEVTMLDADMERFIKLDKENFVGKDATLQQKQTERVFQLVYFEIEVTDSDVRGSEPIFMGDDCVGVTTSGGFGHFVQKSLGFGYVDPANSEPGTELGIDLLGERCRATVLKDPAYDPANERLRA
jgi:dimethylglycine dehydrogenase